MTIGIKITNALHLIHEGKTAKEVLEEIRRKEEIVHVVKRNGARGGGAGAACIIVGLVTAGAPLGTDVVIEELIDEMLREPPVQGDAVTFPDPPV